MSVCLSDRGSIRLSVGNQLVKAICCFFSLNLSWIFLFLVLDKNHGRWKNDGAPKWCKLSTESPYDMESLSTFNRISSWHGVLVNFQRNLPTTWSLSVGLFFQVGWFNFCHLLLGDNHEMNPISHSHCEGRVVRLTFNAYHICHHWHCFSRQLIWDDPLFTCLFVCVLSVKPSNHFDLKVYWKVSRFYTHITQENEA